MRKILLLAFFALSCNTNHREASAIPRTNRATVADAAFSKYLDLLPVLSLPFEATCESCCDIPEIDSANELIVKFKPVGATLVGLVSRSESNAVILMTYAADRIIPVIKVYDLEGNETGDMTFMSGYCGGEPGEYSRQFFQINEDVSFSQIDTLYQMAIDSVTSDALDTIDTKITRKDFIVSEKGEIVEHRGR